MYEALRREYRRFREASPFMLVGSNAQQALSAAKTKLRWERLERLGYVKLEAVPDDDYEWEDKQEREKYGDDGAWGSVGRYTLALDGWDYPAGGPYWTTGDSVWGHVGYKDVLSPYENSYVIGIMDATIEALRKELRNRCPVCRRPMTLHRKRVAC